MVLVVTLLLSCQDQFPDLESIYRRLGRFNGALIEGQMVRPSSVSVLFKISPKGVLWAKYPTSLMVTDKKQTVTWMEDRREYAVAPSEDVNPLPAGFDLLWPGGKLPAPDGQASRATFAGHAALRYPIKMGEQRVELFVDEKTLLPVGTIATAGGTTYEFRYVTVKERAFSASDLKFVPPKDARPAVPGDPNINLIKRGSKLPDFRGKDLDGRSLTSTSLMKGKNGIVLNFWFSACTGCVQEMPAFRGLYPKLTTKNIVLLGLNPIDPVSDAKKTSRQQKLPYRSMVGSAAAKLATALGIRAYPVTIVADATGRVVDAFAGYQSDRLDAAIKKLSK